MASADTKLIPSKGLFQKQCGWLEDDRPWKKIIFFGLLILYFGLILDGRPFATPDEGRYVEIPHEMIERNDFITPHLNGYKYFEKPALFYWVQAGLMKVFGGSETSMRLSLFLIGLGLCISIFNTVKRKHGESCAYLATAIFAFNPFVFAHLHLIILDIPLTLFITTAFFSFYLAMESYGLRRRLLMYGFVVSCGLGILTKGIVILAIVGPVILAWLTVTKQWKHVLPLHLPTCLLIFLAITIPWHALAAMKNPDFLYKYFYVEHFLRYTTSIHKRDQGWWFFLPFLVAGFLPWSMLVLTRAKNLWSNKGKLISLCVLWCGWMLFFYSISKSKLIPYILPMFPALAILCMHIIINWLKEKSFSMKLPGWFLLTLGVATIVGSGYVQHQEIHGSITVFTMALGGILAATGLWLIIKKTQLINALLLCGFTCGLCAHFTLDNAQKPSIKPLATILLKARTDNSPVLSFATYLQDLPYYLGEVVYVYEHLSELEYGQSQVKNDHRYIAGKKELKELMVKHKTVWLVMRKRKWQQYDFSDLPFEVIWQDQHYVLMKSNSSVI